MTTYLGFSVIEYSLVFGGAILAGAALNLYLTRLSDRKDKVSMLYLAAAIFASRSASARSRTSMDSFSR